MKYSQTSAYSLYAVFSGPYNNASSALLSITDSIVLLICNVVYLSFTVVCIHGSAMQC